MITQEFYLINDKFRDIYQNSGQITLLVYSEKNGYRTEYSLRWPVNKELIPTTWFSEVRLSLINQPNQLIILQVDFKPGEMSNLDKEDRLIIVPTQIKGGWQEAREWLKAEYPYQKDCEKIEKLDCSRRMLTGCLDLSSFPNLKEVNCSFNYLTSLDIPKSVKKIEANNNNINSLSNIKAEWETVSLDLNNNPLKISEIIEVIKSLKQNILSEQEQLETNKIDLENKQKELAQSQQELQQVKKSLETLKTNLIDLKKEHQEQINAAQATIQELDKKLTEKEQELKQEQKKHPKTTPTLNNSDNWFTKNKTPLIGGVVILTIGIIGVYLFKKIL